MFGIKDIFTTINLLGGVIAVCLCIEGHPWEAGVAVMLGYLCGDAVDGWIARKLGTSNQFGAEYDTISDHMSHCIAPAAIVYTVYADANLLTWPLGNQLIAGVLASSIVIAASVRHARNIVRPISFKGTWVGLPRTILGFVAIGYANSTLAPLAPGGLWLGVVLIPALGVATLGHFPFPTHRMVRNHFWWVRILITGFFVTSFGAIAVAPQYMFDLVFAWLFGYTTLSWLSLTKEERAAYHETVRIGLQQPIK